MQYKLTPTFMRNSDGSRSTDLNLRFSKGAHYSWIGYYFDDSKVRQWRTGYECRIEHELYRVQLSPQWASGGFLGASVLAELGKDTFGLAGWSRTNLRPTYSLFFDPGDAVTFGAGTRAVDRLDLALFQVRDDRLHTGQRVTHAVARWRPADKQRLTVDLASKRGLDTTGRFVSGYSLAITYDYGDWFARIARDPYVSFTPLWQTRIAVGVRW